MLLKKIGFYLLIGLFYISTVSNVKAKLIEPTPLLNKVLESYNQVYQLGLLTEVKVYDPTAYLPLEEPSEEKLQPYELPGKGFKQDFIFVRDEFSAIETLDFENNILNVFFSQYNIRKAYNFNEERSFLMDDILFPHAVFYTKHLSQLKRALLRYSISPTKVTTYQDKFGYLYQLGDRNNYILVDPDSFRVTELQTNIQLNGRYYPVRIVFSKWAQSNWRDTSKKRLPLVTSFYVNGRLFKEVRVHRRLYRGNYTKKRKFYSKYKTYLVHPLEFPYQLNFSH